MVCAAIPRHIDSESFASRLRCSIQSVNASRPPFFTNPISLGQGCALIRHVQQRFLTDDGIHGVVRQRRPGHIAPYDPHLPVQSDASGQVRRPACATWIQLDAGHRRTVLMGKIARRTGQPGAEIGDLLARADCGAIRQRVYRL